jgi:hypothetical protein
MIILWLTIRFLQTYIVWNMDNEMNNDFAQISTETLELEHSGIELRMGEHGYPMMTFHSTLKNHHVTFELDIQRQQALINNLDVQFCAPVELSLLLKNTETVLSKYGINLIVQQVGINDWHTILKPAEYFDLVHLNEQNNIATISCPTNQLAKAIMSGLGF